MGEFVSLTSVLDEWFDKDRSELPSNLLKVWSKRPRQKAALKFLLSVWDGLSPARRRMMAAQFDASHDPANKVTATMAFEIEAKIQKWEAVPTPTARDLGKQERTLETLRRQFADTDAGEIILATDARTTEGGANVGRPKAAPTSIKIYEDRRQQKMPLGRSKQDEAAEIAAAWPGEGVRKPKVTTIVRHISPKWEADKSSG